MMKKLFVFLTISHLATIYIQAQDSTKKVILINEIATEVLLDKSGNILKKYKELPNYMDGYPTIDREEIETNPFASNLVNNTIKDSELQAEIKLYEFQQELNLSNFDELDRVVGKLKSIDYQGFIILTINTNNEDKDKEVSRKLLGTSKNYLQSNHIESNKILIGYSNESSSRKTLKVYLKSRPSI